MPAGIDIDALKIFTKSRTNETEYWQKIKTSQSKLKIYRLRRASAELSVPRTSLQHLLHSIKLKPYQPQLVHGLLEDNPHRRLQFCKMMRDQFVGEQVETLDKIIWLDEACFKLSGHVNRHNCVYWADENPHFAIEIYGAPFGKKLFVL